MMRLKLSTADNNRVKTHEKDDKNRRVYVNMLLKRRDVVEYLVDPEKPTYSGSMIIQADIAQTQNTEH